MAIMYDSEIYFQAKTNIANQLNSFGRHIEALDLYCTNFKWLHSDVPFVSSYCKAETLIYLTSIIKDDGVRDYYLFDAYNIIKNLFEQIKSHPNQQVNNMLENEQFKKLINYGDEYFKNMLTLEEVNTNIKPKQRNVREYKIWCLENVLFVNLLNGLTTSSFVAARDYLQFPDYKSLCRIIPHLSAAFSAIKRDYCFARYLAFEGVSENYCKFEEKDLFLTDTLDGANYSGKIERLKTSLRITYSIFDSIAVLLLKYFEIESGKKKVYFNKDLFKDHLASLKDNPYIKALFWIQFELFEPSKNLKEIRNALEHNWFRIAEFSGDCLNENCSIDYSYCITEDELVQATLKLLKLARSSLIYFTFIIQFEENKKSQIDNGTDKLVLAMEVPIYK